MMDTIRRAFWIMIGLFVLSLTGVVSFTRPVMIERDALTDPVRVIKLDEQKRLHLEGGRIIRPALRQIFDMDVAHKDLERALQDSLQEVDVEILGPPDQDGVYPANVYVRSTRYFQCGTPYVSVIWIPLFPRFHNSSKRDDLDYAAYRASYDD